MFVLNSMLQRDTIALGHFTLCQLLLMNDNHYPWFVLVPEKDKIREIFELPATDQVQLMQESSFLGNLIYTAFNADKLNIAALGNICPQLHIHHIARYKTDSAWPAPVWGKQAATPYTEEEVNQIIEKLKPGLKNNFTWY